ncbi:MAG: metallophosphoesterase family protein [Candidatus Zixiibacteriota bacterium]
MDSYRIALFGGVYNNYLALEAVCREARSRGISDIYCLGDMGAFGPFPDRVFPLLDEYDVHCIKGNYDDSVARGLDNCQCGYTDPTDNYFARLSYDYTLNNTSAANRRFLASLPDSLYLQDSGVKTLLCHGSPRRVNEFLWESTTPTHLLETFCERYDADVILATHTGLHWKRELAQNRLFANVGVIGRPANDGRTNVWYTIVDFGKQPGAGKTPSRPRVDFVPLDYDFRRLASDMRSENLPEEFVRTVLSGWWTTCLEILPYKERVIGKH